MSSFNKKNTAAKTSSHASTGVQFIATAQANTTNLAGGKAFKLTPHYELVFALLTSFLENEFYKSKKATVGSIQGLIRKINDPKFVAKAAIFARTVYGMRSVSHLVAAELAKHVKGEQWTKNFYREVVHRVDDAAEIMAAYLGLYGKPVPNSLKKGLALGLGKFNRYQLAKYKGENKGIKLVDLFNLVHPKPVEENAGAFKDLMEGNLASEDTWEAELSEAGQLGKTEAEKHSLKGEAWKRLIVGRKIGYFALLRNLRNIVQQGNQETVDAACKLLVDEKLISKSLVLPFRYMTAQEELAKLSNGDQTNVRKLMVAVDDAIEISLKNVPTFKGSTCVVLDDSGSMTNMLGVGSIALNPKSPAAIGSLFAAVLAKTNNADLMMFANDARYYSFNAKDSVTSITRNIRAKMTNGGTNFHSIFQTAQRAYDRMIILSDMQGWIGSNTPAQEYGVYCKRFNCKTKIYSFDLQGLGTLQFPQEGVYTLAGFSEKTMDLLKVLEEDPGALIHQIEAINL